MKNFFILIVSIVLIGAAGLGTYLTEHNAISEGNTTVTDMVNRTVTIPSPVNNVLSTSPTITVIVYMLAPEKLLAFNYETTVEEQKYMPDKYKNLPSVGGWYGSQSGNYEEFIAMNPDLIFDSVSPANTPGQELATLDTLNSRQHQFGTIPDLAVTDSNNITLFNPSIEFVGKILGAGEKASKLTSFNDKVQKQVKDVVTTIPENEKVKVYYAEGSAGLQTEPSNSAHGQLINFCGGINVADVMVQGGSGKTEVSLEQVLKWNPEVIITTELTFYQSVYNDSNWAGITAVKNKRVYLSPQSPFKWFDRPTGTNMVIGIPWVAKILYPDKFKDLNINSLVKEFYSDFYHFDLSDEEINNILKESGMNSTMINGE